TAQFSLSSSRPALTFISSRPLGGLKRCAPINMPKPQNHPSPPLVMPLNDENMGSAYCPLPSIPPKKVRSIASLVPPSKDSVYKSYFLKHLCGTDGNSSLCLCTFPLCSVILGVRSSKK